MQVFKRYVRQLMSVYIQFSLPSLQGNLILADHNYEVLTLLRSHRDDAKGFAIMARHPYPIHTIRLRQPLSAAQLTSALEVADEKQTLRGNQLGVCVAQRNEVRQTVDAANHYAHMFVVREEPPQRLYACLTCIDVVRSIT